MCDRATYMVFRPLLILHVVLPCPFYFFKTEFSRERVIFVFQLKKATLTIILEPFDISILYISSQLNHILFQPSILLMFYLKMDRIRLVKKFADFQTIYHTVVSYRWSLQFPTYCEFRIRNWNNWCSHKSALLQLTSMLAGKTVSENRVTIIWHRYITGSNIKRIIIETKMLTLYTKMS